MAKEVIWTGRATDDLYQIFESLSAYSNTRAESVIETIIDKVFLLEQFPKMGRVVPELNLESIREIVVQQYRIIYTLTANGSAEILAVRHSSRPISDI